MKRYQKQIQRTTEWEASRLVKKVVLKKGDDVKSCPKKWDDFKAVVIKKEDDFEKIYQKR